MKTMKRTIRGKKPTETKLTVTQDSELMAFLMASFPSKSREKIKSLLRNKLVSSKGLAITKFNHPLSKGDVLVIGKKSPTEEKQIPGLKIVFEDDAVIVIEKPAGLLTMGSEKERNKTAYAFLSNYVKKQDDNNRIFIVHRIDRETSGLLVFAKNERIKLRMQKNWNDQIIERKYLALVEGVLTQRKGTIQSYLRESKALKVHSSQHASSGQLAITHYEVLGYKKNTTVVEVQLETGRKNQIRVHMQDLGHPIVGDKKYGAKSSLPGRIALHAKTLVFSHPITGKEMRFETKEPGIFK